MPHRILLICFVMVATASCSESDSTPKAGDAGSTGDLAAADAGSGDRFEFSATFGDEGIDFQTGDFYVRVGSSSGDIEALTVSSHDTYGEFPDLPDAWGLHIEFTPALAAAGAMTPVDSDVWAHWASADGSLHLNSAGNATFRLTELDSASGRIGLDADLSVFSTSPDFCDLNDENCGEWNTAPTTGAAAIRLSGMFVEQPQAECTFDSDCDEVQACEGRSCLTVCVPGECPAGQECVPGENTQMMVCKAAT